MVTTVGNSFIGYVFWVICAQSFTPSQVGTVSALIAAATIASTLSDLGLRTMLMQQLPRERERQAWSQRVSGALLLATASSTVFGVAAVLLSPLLSAEISRYMDVPVALGVVLLSILTTIFTLLDGVSMSEHRSGQVLVRGTIYGAVKVLVVGGLVATSLSSSRLILLATVVGVAGAVSWGVLRQIPAARPDWQFAVRGTVAGLRSVRGVLAGHYVLNLGGWLPAFVLPLEVVARLSARQNAYMTLTWLVGYAFFTVSPSVSSALFVQGRWNPDDLRAITARATKLIAALLVPAGIFLVLFGRWILELFGPGYAHYGYPLLMILLIAAVPDAVTNVRIGRLRAQGQLHSGARLNSGMAIISVGLAWILLPHLGIIAVGIAWLAAQSAGSVWGFVEDRSSSRLRSGDIAEVSAAESEAASRAAELAAGQGRP